MRFPYLPCEQHGVGVGSCITTGADTGSVVSCIRAFSGHLDRYPNDVIAPCIKGTKHPIIKHREYSWRWCDFDMMMNTQQADVDVAFDFCVLLHDLCVVDVDDTSLVADLELRFPILRRVPSVLTRRGKHYWFRRSMICDAYGFYDSSGRVKKGIDFKTVCGNGTRGVIMIPPSEGKMWSCECSEEDVVPWCECSCSRSRFELIPIPYDLLIEVATPTTNPCGPAGREPSIVTLDNPDALVHLRFVGDDSRDLSASLARSRDGSSNKGVVTVRRRQLAHMMYFEPYLADETELASAEDHIPVPMHPAYVTAFLALLRLMDNDICFSRTLPPTKGFLDDITAVCDMLDLRPQTLVRQVMCCVYAIRFHVDLYSVSPSMWIDHLDAAANKDEIIRLDDGVVSSLLYAPVRAPLGLTLFGEFSIRPAVKAGERLMRGRPSAWLMQQLPPVVVDILRAFPENLVLAGGAVVGELVEPCEPGADYDIFVVCDTSDEADELLKGVYGIVLGETTRVVRSKTAITFIIRLDAGEDANETTASVQVITRVFRDKHSVIRSFDFTPCRIMTYFERGGTEPVVECTSGFINSVRSMSFVVDLASWNICSCYRILKYAAKGFEVLLPGLCRKAFQMPPETKVPRVWTLMRVERMVMKNASAPVTRSDGSTASLLEKAAGCFLRPKRKEHAPKTAEYNRTGVQSNRNAMPTIIRKSVNCFMFSGSRSNYDIRNTILATDIRTWTARSTNWLKYAIMREPAPSEADIAWSVYSKGRDRDMFVIESGVNMMRFQRILAENPPGVDSHQF